MIHNPVAKYAQQSLNKENFIDFTRQVLLMSINGIGRQALKKLETCILILGAIHKQCRQFGGGQGGQIDNMHCKYLSVENYTG